MPRTSAKLPNRSSFTTATDAAAAGLCRIARCPREDIVYLGDTPEAAHLKKLLRDEGADGGSVSIPVGSMIVASGGGGTKGEKPKSSRAKTNENGK